MCQTALSAFGLTDVTYGEMIEFEGGIYGMALNLEDSVGAVVLGDYLSLKKVSPVNAQAAFLKCR